MVDRYAVGILVGCSVLIAGTLLLGQRLGAGESLEDRIALWDLLFKAAAGLIALTGAMLAIVRYFDDRAKSRETALLEARKPFFTKQQQVYTDLLTATATVSTIEDYDDPASVDAEQQFWTIFWGSLPMVTDEPVAVVADDMAALLAPRSQDWIALRNTSMDLSRACRASLGFESPLPAKGPVTARADARPGT